MLHQDINNKVQVVLNRMPAKVEDYKVWIRPNRATLMFVVSLDELSTVEDILKILRRFFMSGNIRVTELEDGKYIIHVYVQALQSLYRSL